MDEHDEAFMEAMTDALAHLEQYANDPTIDVPDFFAPPMRWYEVRTEITFRLCTEEDPVDRVSEVLANVLSDYTEDWTQPQAQLLDES